MTQRNNLYRRSSGIYVLRITVPDRYRVQLGQREIHASTRTTDLSAAKAVALHLMARWHSCISELKQANETKVLEGSPLLAGVGFISIQDFCETFEVAAELVLQEILNNNIFVACRLNAQPIYWVDDYTTLDREIDTDGFVLNNAFQEGTLRTFTGYLKPFHRSHTVSNIIENGYSDETAFHFKTNTLAAAFCALPGIRLTTSSVFITKVQAERIRAHWVKVLEGKPVLLAATSAPTAFISAPTASPALPCECCRPDRAKQLVQEVETGKGSDALVKRPTLKAALEFCRRRGATLVIAKLDRLARNVHFVSGLMESRAEFVACDMPEANELNIHIMAAFAEHEAKRISQRTKEALAAAKARGVVLGAAGAANLKPNMELRQQTATAFVERLRPIFDGMAVRGLSQRAMVAELNDWHPNT